MEKQIFVLTGTIRFNVTISVEAANLNDAIDKAKEELKEEYMLDTHGMSHEVGLESIDLEEY